MEDAYGIKKSDHIYSRCGVGELYESGGAIGVFAIYDLLSDQTVGGGVGLFAV
jgi:hypothetical protein